VACLKSTVMKAEEREYDLDELARVSGFTTRTVRYYIQRGLLPSPGTGRGLKYGEAYLDRLGLIRQLQKQHLPLDEIRKRLAGMSDEDVRKTCGQGLSVRSSAADYIAGVLAEPQTSGQDFFSKTAKTVSDQTVARVDVEKTTWDRYRVADDIELHVRRPGTREGNRRSERIIAAAQRILKE